MAARALKKMGLFWTAAALMLTWNGNVSAETTKERILREGRIVIGIRPGSPVRVIVNRDLVMQPYGALTERS